MTWKDITIKQWSDMKDKSPEEILMILGENMTITEFNKTDWTFLTEKPKPGLLKEKYVINGIEYKPNIDPRSWSVEQYVTFTNGQVNDKLNVIFNTKDVDYSNMSVLDFEEVMFFFIQLWKTCVICFQKYSKKNKLPQMINQQLQVLESLVFWDQSSSFQI